MISEQWSVVSRCCIDGFDEELVNAAVVRELGMKSGCQDAALADQHRKAIACGERLDAGADLADARRADEDHLQRATGKLGLGDTEAW